MHIWHIVFICLFNFIGALYFILIGGICFFYLFFLLYVFSVKSDFVEQVLNIIYLYFFMFINF